MKKIVLVFVLAQCAAHAFDHLPRLFTNGHGGYQFFHADEDNRKVAERRVDIAGSFSDAVNYVVKIPPPTPQPDQPTSAALTMPEVPDVPAVREVPAERATVTSAPSLAAKLLGHRLASKRKWSNSVLGERVSENRIFPDATTPAPRPPLRYTTPAHVALAATRKRVVVRKFKPQAQPKPPAEKNKKREISAATGSGPHAARGKIPHKYKFTNRNFKPLPTQRPRNNAPPTSHRDRSALFTRKPSDKFMQLHFRTLDVTTTTTAASSMQGMKEKRHLANVRFFNRRKLRT